MPRLFVNNLPFKASEEDIVNFFSTYGEVTKVILVTDHEHNRPKGYGFVDIDPIAQFQDSSVLVNVLDGLPMMGRRLNIAMANERKFKGGSGSRPPAKDFTNTDHRDGGYGHGKKKGKKGKGGFRSRHDMDNDKGWQ